MCFPYGAPFGIGIPVCAAHRYFLVGFIYVSAAADLLACVRAIRA